MSGYGRFAYYYDSLTGNIDYKSQADYFDGIIRKFGGKQGGILLDLACGTGSLSEEMARRGYDVIGVDSSQEMLSAALDKKFESGLPVQYLCQDMTELDMFGTIDITICALDSLNHLDSVQDIRKAIEKVSLFSEYGGLFIFDVNMPYKHRNTLADSTFVYETDDVYCVWQNYFDEESADCRVDISLDFFEKNKNGTYSRFTEDFSEIAFERGVIEKMLTDSGFEILAEYDYNTMDPPREDSEKIVFAARNIIPKKKYEEE